MKIVINYDLISKISEAKNGFSLQKSTKKLLGSAALAGAISAVCGLVYNVPTEEIVKDSLQLTLLYAFMHGTAEFVTNKFTKIIAIDKLKELSNNLKMININTNSELLLKAYKYQTNYKLNTTKSKLPRLEQTKYIMVPIYENGEEKEVSLMQEHIIGTDEYYISFGEPKKILKLAFNPS